MLVVVSAVLATVGVVVHRAVATALVASGVTLADNTPMIDLPYGGGQRLVVDDAVGTVHPIIFSVENAGPDTMTLQGVDDFLSADVAGFTMSRVGAEGPAAVLGTAPQLPLAGVRLRPGQQIDLTMRVEGQGCVSSAVGAATTISTVPVTVSIMGFQRVEWVALPDPVTVMNNPNEGSHSDPRNCLRHGS